MKHEILEEVWRVRDQIGAECGHDLKKLAALLRREESRYGPRLARLPIRRKSVPSGEQASADGPLPPALYGEPTKTATALHEDPPEYGRKASRTRSRPPRPIR
jgi:hypothetical protein